MGLTPDEDIWDIFRERIEERGLDPGNFRLKVRHHEWAGCSQVKLHRRSGDHVWMNVGSPYQHWGDVAERMLDEFNFVTVDTAAVSLNGTLRGSNLQVDTGETGTDRLRQDGWVEKVRGKYVYKEVVR